jgi:hypothetical protein
MWPSHLAMPDLVLHLWEEGSGMAEQPKRHEEVHGFKILT